MPVLLIGGGDSPHLFRLLINGLSERLPDARVEIIENGSHIIHEDAPATLNARIKEFLASGG